MQKVIFAVATRATSLLMRAHVEQFEQVTQLAGHKWLLIDLTRPFPTWMAAQEYRDAYFECPEDLDGYAIGEITEFIGMLVLTVKTQINSGRR